MALEIHGWTFSVDEPHVAVVRPPAGEELTLRFSEHDDEIYAPPCDWFSAALNDAAETMGIIIEEED